MYAHGKREIEGDSVPFLLSVNAAQFKVFAAMFRDEDQVKIAPTPTGISITSGTARVHLTKLLDLREDDLVMPRPESAMYIARMPAGTLIGEVDAASAFVSTSNTQPAFQGVRLDFAEKDGMYVSAYDGSGAFYRSYLPIKLRAEKPGHITLPWDDFLKGARLIGDGTVTLIKDKHDAVYLLNKRALFRTTVLMVTWPDITKLTEHRNSTHFKVDSGQLRDLVNSARALGSEMGVDVTESKGRVLFKTESEAGAFRTSVRGHITTALRYDVETLAKVVKLGPVLDFYVPEKNYEPTIVQCDDRKCWILTRV